MKYAIVHHFPGGTKEQYDAVLEAVHGLDGTLPDGQIFHAAGESADGLTVMAVHETKESWERFRDEILMPRMQAGIEGGFTTAPQPIEFEVHNFVTTKTMASGTG